MKWYNVSHFKMYVFFFTLFLYTVWDEIRFIVSGYPWNLYLALSALTAIPIRLKIFPRKKWQLVNNNNIQLIKFKKAQYVKS